MMQNVVKFSLTYSALEVLLLLIFLSTAIKARPYLNQGEEGKRERSVKVICVVLYYRHSAKIKDQQRNMGGDKVWQCGTKDMRDMIDVGCDNC